MQVRGRKVIVDDGRHKSEGDSLPSSMVLLLPE